MGRLYEWLFSGQGFFFLIIFGGWIVSTIGSAMQKVAKKAAEQQARQQRRKQSEPVAEVPEHVPGQMQRMAASKGQMASVAPKPAKPESEVLQHVPGQMQRMAASRGQMASVAPKPAKVESEVPPVAATVEELPGQAEIAAEIRRLMGMEPVALQQAQPEPQPEQSEPTLAPAVPEPSMTRQHAASGHLSEEMRRRDSETQHLGSLADRKFTSGSRIADRRLDTALTRRSDQEEAEAAKARAKRRQNISHALDLSRPASAFLAGEVFGQPRALKGWET